MRWLVLVVTLTGCTRGLDSFNQFKDIRVLGVQAEPPAVLKDPTDDPTLAAVFTALVVDPRGGDVQYTWQFCPLPSSNACDDFDAQLALIDAPDAVMLRGLRALGATGTVPAGTAMHGAASYAVPAFDLAQAASAAGVDLKPLYAYFLKTSLLGEGLGVWPTAVLTVTNLAHGDTTVAQKRVVYGLKSLAALAGPLAGQYGITLCPPTGTKPAGCLDLPTFTPNHNPVFADLQFAMGARFTTDFQPLTQPATVPAGQSIQFRPLFTPESAETYQILRGSLQTRDIEVQTRVEALSVTWFCSAGSLAHGLTWPLFTKTLNNTFAAPSSPPADSHGQVTCWLVGRDQRGGEVWQSLEIQVTP